MLGPSGKTEYTQNTAAVPSDKTPLVPVSLLPELPTAAGATRQALGAGNVGHAFSQLLKLQDTGYLQNPPQPASPRAPGEALPPLTSGSWGLCSRLLPPHPSFSF